MKYLVLILFVPFIGKKYKTVYDIITDDTVALYNDSLYVGITEVSNEEYLEFTNYIKEQNPTDYKASLPNSKLWNTITNKPTDYEEFYFKHPAYKNYPVVNVNNLQAELFCEWKTDQLNILLAKIPIEKRDSIKSFKVRLPTRIEWRDAALGGLPPYTKYAWKGASLRNEKGEFKCSFHYTTGDINVGDKKIKSSDDLIAPVNSFDPNSIGVYNVCGNVAEMLYQDSIAVGGHWQSFEDEVTLNSFIKVKKESPLVGFRYVIELNR